MPTFVLMKVKKKKFYWWMLKITTVEELKDYYKKVELGMWQEGYNQFLHCKDGLIKDRFEHFTNNRALALMYRHKKVSAQMERGDIPKDNRPAIFLFAEWIDDMGFNTKLKNLLRCGVLYINAAGGFNMGSKDWKEVRTITKSKYIWPGNENIKPSIKKWPNGTHYYAKIGGVDVVVDGEQKWDTREEAQEAIDRFLSE